MSGENGHGDVSRVDLGSLKVLAGAGDPDEREHKARPGIRAALICPDERCVPPFRAFAKPGWTCPQHGKAVVQANRPYRGQATS